MTKVFVLTAQDDTYATDILGIFTTRELAEARIVREALSGTTLRNVQLQEHPVHGTDELDPRDPLSHPSVIRALIDSKKILAIKELRHFVFEATGVAMGLKEAKDAVEAVDLLNLSVPVREAALALSGDFYETVPPQPVRRRHEHVHEPFEWDLLIDDDGDEWVHVGDGRYVLRDSQSGTLPFVDTFAPLTEGDLADMHGIKEQRDF